MKKIAISSNTAWTVFNHRAGLIKAFQKKGYEVHSVAPASNFTGLENPGTVFHEVKNLERKGKNPFADIFLIFEYLKIYREIAPEAVFSYTIKPNIYSAFACRILGIPSICTVNGLGTAFGSGRSFMPGIAGLLYKAAFKKVCAVLFQNREDRDFFTDRKIVSADKVFLVPGSGVDLEKFVPAENVNKRMLFMLISRMLVNKGVPEFIEAGKKLHREYPDTEFVLLGPVDSGNPMGVKSEILDALDPAEGVVYAGAVHDVRPFIADCSAVVLPSYYREGIPKILIEALAMGRPVITTDMPGCRETVIPGKNGFFVKAASSSDLYDTLKKFIELPEDERKKMGKQSRLMAEGKFDEKKVIAVYAEIFEKIKKS